MIQEHLWMLEVRLAELAQQLWLLIDRLGPVGTLAWRQPQRQTLVELGNLKSVLAVVIDHKDQMLLRLPPGQSAHRP